MKIAICSGCGKEFKQSRFAKKTCSRDCRGRARGRPFPTLERIHELLKYDRTTGSLYWKMKRGPNAAFGQRAGTLLNAHRVVAIDGFRILEHHVVWMIETGKWPDGEIDHKNTISDDNRFSNIRAATRTINSQNMIRARKDNGSGLLGATFCPFTGRWKAKIGHKGKQIHLGRFDTPQLAHEAYVKAKRIFHEGCTL